MKIGIFSDTFLPQINGVSTVVDVLVRELRELGHQPLLFVPDYPEIPREERVAEEEQGIYRFPSFTFAFHRESRVVLPLNRQAYRRLPELEIIHSHTPFSIGLYALWAAREFQIPHVHHYHTLFTEYRHYLPRPFRPSARLAERISAWFCNSCDVIITPSEPMRRELERYGVSRPIHSLPFGVDLREFQAELDWDARRGLGIPEGAPLLLHAGRIAREKNLRFLLRAFREMLNRKPELWLVLTGNGPQRPELEEYAKELGISDHVVFTGYLPREQLLALYKQADLFVFASKTETQGLVLVEAMAAGTPVVALGALGVLDVVHDGKDGLLLDPEIEPQGYATAVVELLHDEGRRRRLAQGARETAEEMSAQRSVRRILEIYHDLLAEAKPD